MAPAASSVTCAAGGFTYIGLLIFIAVLGLASATTVSVGSLVQQRADEAELLFIGAQYAAAFQSFVEATPAGQPMFPVKLDDLLRDPRYPGIKRHLRKNYIDPMTGTSEWGLVTAGGGVTAIYSRSSKAPLRIAGFDVGFAALANRKKYSEWVFGIPVAAPNPGARPATATEVGGQVPVPDLPPAAEPAVRPVRQPG